MNLKLIIPVLLFILIQSKITGQTVKFEYDDNGNRTSRILISQELQSGSVSFPVLNPEALSPKMINNGAKGSENINSENIESINADLFSEDDKISAKIFPNPNKGILKIEISNLPLQAKKEMRVYDLSGTELIVVKDFDSYSELNIEHLTDGIYILRIYIDKTLFDFKVIKNR